MITTIALSMMLNTSPLLDRVKSVYTSGQCDAAEMLSFERKGLTPAVCEAANKAFKETVMYASDLEPAMSELYIKISMAGTCEVLGEETRHRLKSNLPGSDALWSFTAGVYEVSVVELAAICIDVVDTTHKVVKELEGQ